MLTKEKLLAQRQQATFTVNGESKEGWVYYNTDDSEGEERWVGVVDGEVVAHGVADEHINYVDLQHHREVRWFTDIGLI